MSTTSRLVIALAAALVAEASAAPPPEAKRLYGDAMALLAKKKHVEAGRAFEAAFAVAPNHAYLFNAGFAYEAGGDPVNALRLFEKFAVFSTNRARVAEARAKVVALERRLSMSHGRLKLDVEPAGAFALVDGDPKLVEVPFERWLKAGEHSIEVRKSGHESRSLLVSIAAGEVKPVRVRLEPEARFGGLLVETTPAGADVRVGDAAPVRSPLTLAKLSAGRHVVRVTREGFEPVERVVAVDAGVTSRVTVALVAAAKPAPIDAPVPPSARAVRPSVFGTWWFWTITGAVVTSAVVTGVVLGTAGDGKPSRPHYDTTICLGCVKP